VLPGTKHLLVCCVSLGNFRTLEHLFYFTPDEQRKVEENNNNNLINLFMFLTTFKANYNQVLGRIFYTHTYKQYEVNNVVKYQRKKART
jgi:hypothetical protein